VALLLRLKVKRALCVSFLLLTCCGTPADDRSPSYQLGYSDGCGTASREMSGLPSQPQRNESLYDQDKDYRAGWLSGHSQCRMPTTGTPLTR
jgi:hypothetical protein